MSVVRGDNIRSMHKDKILYHFYYTEVRRQKKGEDGEVWNNIL